MHGWVSDLVRWAYDSRLGDLAVRLGLRSSLRSAYARGLYHAYGTERAVEVGELTAAFVIDAPETAFEVHQNVANETPIIREFVAEATPGDVFYDVGAGVGSYACFVGQAVETTVPFEPDPPRYDVLRRNLARNGIDGPPHDAALGEVTGAGETNEYVEAAVVNGDDYRAENGLPVPDLVKIDVDGPELHVLRGLEGTLADAARLVWIEVHPNRLERRGHSVDDLVALLEGVGFDVERRSIRGLKSPFLRGERSDVGGS